MNVLANPVFVKELKSTVRARQSPAVLLTIAGLLGAGVVYVYYQVVTFMLRYGGTNAGSDGWQAALVLQVVLIWMLCPALAANAITKEREQQTWEMLVFTLLRPSEIVLGKLCARLLPAAILLLLFLPFTVFSLAISPSLALAECLAGYVWLVSSAVFLTTTGLFFSWIFRKTASALACAYLVVFVLLIGLPLLVQVVHYGRYDAWSWSPVLWLCPIRVTGAILAWSGDPYAIPILGASTTVFVGVVAFLILRMVMSFRALSVE